MARLRGIWERLRELRCRPVQFQSVLATYIGIIAIAFYAFSADNANDNARVKDAQAAADLVVQESKRADRAIVRTGQAAVRSGCEFDNQRAIELRGIISRSIRNVKSLERRGAISTELARHSIRINRRSLRNISVRDCDAAAAVLTAEPKE
jgi:hypothetical protein